MDYVKSQMELLSENTLGIVNYVSWRFKLNLMLKLKHLFLVARTTKRPEGEETIVVTNWIKKDLNSQALIGLNFSSNTENKIANCKLNSLYGKKFDMTIKGLQKRSFSYSYNAIGSAVENSLADQQLAQDLAPEGEEIKKG